VEEVQMVPRNRSEGSKVHEGSGKVHDIDDMDVDDD
jgi:hypothetical protein